MSDPLSSLDDIEQNMQQVSPQQELAMIKAPMYQSQKQTDLLIETTINALYQQLMEKTAVIKALQSEISKLKEKPKKPQSEVNTPHN